MAVNYNPKIVTSGLVLCLDAANTKSYPGSGTTWTDLSGNGNTGTLTNGPTFNSGNNGYILFDGVNDYVDTGYSTNNAIFTLEIWYRPTTLPGSIEVFVGKYSGSGNDWWLGTSNSKLTFSANGSELPGTSTTLLVANTWHHIVAIKDNLTRTMYINSRFELTSSITSCDPGGNIMLGKFGSGATFYHDFGSSIFRIYNRALSAAEVAQNYNAMRGRFGI